MERPRILVRERARERVVPLPGGRLTIGRDPSNGLPLGGRADISRRHYEILQENGTTRLRDLDSQYGTYVNGERIQTRTLEHGDRIHLAVEEEPELVYLVQEGVHPAPPARPAAPVETTMTELQSVTDVVGALRLLGTAGVFSQVLARIVDGAIRLAGADRGFLLLPDAHGRLAVRTARGRGGVPLDPSAFERSERLPREVIETGKVRFLDLTDPSQAREHGRTVSLGIRSAACIPLDTLQQAEEADGSGEAFRRVGVLYLDSRRRLHLCSPLALPLLESLAQKAAMSIWNVQLLQEAEDHQRDRRTLQIAAEIQISLQPPDSLQGSFFEVAGCSVPCQSVGGDFFDYFVASGEERVSLVLADVAGKGLPAALMASLVQGGFSALTRDAREPACVVGSLNDLLAARGNPSRFVTLFTADLEPSGRVRACNAGHNPPMIARSNGSLEWLEVAGFPLGIFPDQRYRGQVLTMQPEDLLVVFSDGVTGALNGQEEFFGEERLAECLFELRGRPATDVLHCIHEAVKDFVDHGPFQDDLTILVARYLGNPANAD